MDKKLINIYDLLLSIAIYIIIFAFIILLANVFYNKTTIELVGIVFDSKSLSAVFYTVMIMLIIAYLKRRNFKLRNFYLDFSSRHQLSKGLLLGLGISTFLALFFLTKFLFIDSNSPIVHYTFLEYLYHGLYFLVFVALVEEFLFRSFFQTMFKEVIKNEVISVILVGLLFSLMHLVTLSLDAPGVTFGEFLQLKLMNILSLFSMHCLFYLITKKYNNILPVVMIHFVWNFALFILK